MKNRRCFVVLFSVLSSTGITSKGQADSTHPNFSSGRAFTHNVHREITEKALSPFLSSGCLRVVVDANNDQDRGKEADEPRNHFDNDLICESHGWVENRAKELDRAESPVPRLKILGRILHALQDFYSHSNYVEALVARESKLVPGAAPLFDFSLYCKTRPQYLDLGEIFTGNASPHPSPMLGFASREEFANPRSHLHLNKDLSPDEDPRIVGWYSRSSLLRTERGTGVTYFALASELALRETQAWVSRLAEKLPPLAENCRR